MRARPGRHDDGRPARRDRGHRDRWRARPWPPCSRSPRRERGSRSSWRRERWAATRCHSTPRAAPWPRASRSSIPCARWRRWVPAMLVVRHPAERGAAARLRALRWPVLNAGDGWHAHPTQALLDLYTLREVLGDERLAGAKVCIVGDVLHSRVARSNIWALTCWGIDVWITGPDGLPARLRGVGAGAPGWSPADGHGRPRGGHPRRRGGDGVARPARAAGGRRRAIGSCLCGALGADRGAAAAPRARRHRDAPGAGQRRRGAAAGCGIGTTVGHHPPGRQRGAGAHGGDGAASPEPHDRRPPSTSRDRRSGLIGRRRRTPRHRGRLAGRPGARGARAVAR